MIVDTSALVAVLRREPEASAFAYAMQAAETLRLSAATYVEASVVIDGERKEASTRWLDAFLSEGAFIIEPVTVEQARIARAAYRDFGRGSGHPARLNFGDCFAYALARALDEPLLFKGEDFAHTDVKRAL